MRKIVKMTITSGLELTPAGFVTLNSYSGKLGPRELFHDVGWFFFLHHMHTMDQLQHTTEWKNEERETTATTARNQQKE